MPALAESNLTSTYLQLRERTFIGIESFLGFLDQAGLEARQMEFDPERGVATAPDGRYSVYLNCNRISFTYHGIELLLKHSKLDPTELVAIAKSFTSESAGLLCENHLRSHSEDYYRNAWPVQKVRPDPPGVKFAVPPSALKDLSPKWGESTGDYLMRRGGVDLSHTAIDLLNRELGRRQLFLRALTGVMRDAGFADYDACDAFYRTGLVTGLTMTSAPLISSSEFVADLFRALTPNEQFPESSTNSTNAYTYFDRDIFGYSFSFGFAYLSYTCVDKSTPMVSFPLIGVDQRLIDEVATLSLTPSVLNGEIFQNEVTDRFIAALRYIWEVSSIASHDDIHALATDLSVKIKTVPFVRFAVGEAFKSIRDEFGGNFDNEQQASSVHGQRLLYIRQQRPEIPLAIARQTLDYIDNIAGLYSLGLSEEACAYLLCIGLSHAKMVVGLDEKIAEQEGVSIWSHLSEVPFLQDEGRLGKLGNRLRAKSLSFELPSVPIPNVHEVGPFEADKFHGNSSPTPDQAHYLARFLARAYDTVKALEDKGLAQVPEFLALNRRVEFAGEITLDRSAKQTPN